MSADPHLDEATDADVAVAEEGASEGGRPDDRVDDARHDEENRLKPEYVRAVRLALEEDRRGEVYELVEPLHPADVADLLELLDNDERGFMTIAISDLMTGEVVAELNDWVREEMMEGMPAEAVALIAEQLETDDAVQMIEDMDLSLIHI